MGLTLGLEAATKLGGVGVEDVEVEEKDAAEDDGEEADTEVADALRAGPRVLGTHLLPPRAGRVVRVHLQLLVDQPAVS